MSMDRMHAEAFRLEGIDLNDVHKGIAEGLPVSAPARTLAIIEQRPFLQECLRRSLQSAFPLPVRIYPTLEAFNARDDGTIVGLVVVVLTAEGALARGGLADLLNALVAAAPVVAVSEKNDLGLTRAVMRTGAKGFIPMTMGFDAAVEVVRFVMAGGTYVPPESLLSGLTPAEAAKTQRTDPVSPITDRQLAVVRAIQQGKSNKVIAYELNMTESTVKVHVRNIIKRLGAKNRTDVAIKTSGLFACRSCPPGGCPADLD